MHRRSRFGTCLGTCDGSPSHSNAGCLVYWPQAAAIAAAAAATTLPEWARGREQFCVPDLLAGTPRVVWRIDRTGRWWWYEEEGCQTALAYQPLAAPQPNVIAAALPAVLPQVIPAALAAGEELAVAARAREEAGRLRTQADQATQAAANQAALALVAAEHAAAEAHIYADELDQSKAERAVESAIADSTRGRVQTATLDIAQAAAAREEAAATFNGIDAVVEATAQQALTGGKDEVSWSRLGPADITPSEDPADDAVPGCLGSLCRSPGRRRHGGSVRCS